MKGSGSSLLKLAWGMATAGEFPEHLWGQGAVHHRGSLFLGCVWKGLGFAEHGFDQRQVWAGPRRCEALGSLDAGGLQEWAVPWGNLSRAPLRHEAKLASATAPKGPGAAGGPRLWQSRGPSCKQDLCHQILLIPFLFFIGYISLDQRLSNKNDFKIFF